MIRSGVMIRSAERGYTNLKIRRPRNQLVQPLVNGRVRVRVAHRVAVKRQRTSAAAQPVRYAVHIDGHRTVGDVVLVEVEHRALPPLFHARVAARQTHLHLYLLETDMHIKCREMPLGRKSRT
jgi:hypothetical protein